MKPAPTGMHWRATGTGPINAALNLKMSRASTWAGGVRERRMYLDGQVV
ncbi:hypothetical protein GF325_17650 [Candidatus Bathyarchaeota archaeon]|nr:hypothetical protein [Candidatus Bathyarchaeota archaeon]